MGSEDPGHLPEVRSEEAEERVWVWQLPTQATPPKFKSGLAHKRP